MTTEQLKFMKESEHRVEFKECKTGTYSYNGGSKNGLKDRRRCVLGYITAFANEGGGYLIFGMHDKYPHRVVGTTFHQDALGKLEQDIYRDKGIRVKIEELFDEENKRVVLIEIPSRPIGTVFKFEDVALMRVGEELLPMSEEQYLRIIQEQEPDFSAKICDQLLITDLSEKAIKEMKKAYASNQNNPIFLSLSTDRVLSDLGLLKHGKLTYAALILLGTEEAIHKYLPQAQTIWEFRFGEGSISYDFREVINEPLFIGIDKIWDLINDKNAQIPIRIGARIATISSFNEEVIREAVLNAITHRDYSITSEVVVKQYPKKLVISNPGGFPKGVTIDNIIAINSTPRSRLMAEVLEKTGYVERSGQGIDKIFSITLSEGKPEPDYKSSDNYQVVLKLGAHIEDKAFYDYLRNAQFGRTEENKLHVDHVITLYKIKEGRFSDIKIDTLNFLERERLIKKAGGHTNRYVLGGSYEEVASKEQRIGTRYLVTEVDSILKALYGVTTSIGNIEKSLSRFTNRNQIKYLISKLCEDKIVQVEGKAKGTKYKIADSISHSSVDELIDTVIDMLKVKYD